VGQESTFLFFLLSWEHCPASALVHLSKQTEGNSLLLSNSKLSLCAGMAAFPAGLSSNEHLLLAPTAHQPCSPLDVAVALAFKGGSITVGRAFFTLCRIQFLSVSLMATEWLQVRNGEDVLGRAGPC